MKQNSYVQSCQLNADVLAENASKVISIPFHPVQLHNHYNHQLWIKHVLSAFTNRPIKDQCLFEKKRTIIQKMQKKRRRKKKRRMMIS